MPLNRSCMIVYAVATAAFIPAVSGAAENVAQIVSAVGEVKAGPIGEDLNGVGVGSKIPHGAWIETGKNGRCRLLLADDSALELGPGSRVVLQRVGSKPDRGSYRTLQRLTRGTLHVLVSARYGVAGSRYEVETASAVVASGGGEFVIVHEAVNGATRVFAMDGDLEVQATIGVVGPAVEVAAGEYTEIPKDRFAERPRAFDRAKLASVVHLLEIVGTGDREEGVRKGHPALTARVLRPEDLPAVLAEGVGGGRRTHGVALGTEHPGTSLPERVSPDLRFHRQPIPEFRAARPGEKPVGGVQVDF